MMFKKEDFEKIKDESITFKEMKKPIKNQLTIAYDLKNEDFEYRLIYRIYKTEEGEYIIRGENVPIHFTIQVISSRFARKIIEELERSNSFRIRKLVNAATFLCHQNIMTEEEILKETRIRDNQKKYYGLG